jgi:hypothetical protein
LNGRPLADLRVSRLQDPGDVALFFRWRGGYQPGVVADYRNFSIARAYTLDCR